MLQIVYASAAATPMSQRALSDMLIHARTKNERINVTGFLLYDEGSFLQVIEGPDAAVEGLYAAIAADPRHHRLRLLSRKTVAEREFGDWTMAFARKEELPPPDGYLDYEANQEEFSEGGGEVGQILTLFQAGLLRQAEEGGLPNDGRFTVSLAPHPDGRRPGGTFLMDFGRVLALSMPDVEIAVSDHAGEKVHYNLRRDMEKGEAELF